MRGQLHTETARGGRLAHAALATDKDPLQGLLIENILQARFGKIRVVEISQVGHDR